MYKKSNFFCLIRYACVLYCVDDVDKKILGRCAAAPGCGRATVTPGGTCDREHSSRH